MKPKPCPHCAEHDRQLSELLKTLDRVKAAESKLVMWPNADMRWYVINTEIAGLLAIEREYQEIINALYQHRIRPESTVIQAVIKSLDGSR